MQSGEPPSKCVLPQPIQISIPWFFAGALIVMI
jgi:hypothetical protein